jgi:hypothetical protein
MKLTAKSTATALILAIVLAPALAAEEPSREPQGLKMQRTVNGEPESVLIPWGASPEEIQSLLPRTSPSALGSTSAVSCYGSMCTLSEDWRIDTGEVSFINRPTLKLHDAKFYQYTMLVPANEFDKMFDILAAALGEPTESEDIPRQNAYGARWTGLIRTWRTQNCEVTLMAQLSRINDGLLMVVHKPLAPVEKQAEGKAPF